MKDKTWPPRRRGVRSCPLSFEKFINPKKLYHWVIAAARRGTLCAYPSGCVGISTPTGRGGTHHPFPGRLPGAEGVTVLMTPFRFTNADVRRSVRTMLGKMFVTC